MIRRVTVLTNCSKVVHFLLSQYDPFTSLWELCFILPFPPIISSSSSVFLTTIPLTQILWRKDGRRISPGKDDNLVMGADGSLTIVTARAQDAGSYQCVAKNDGFRRESASATLTVKGTIGTCMHCSVLYTFNE